MIKVLGFSGSPREGNSAFLLKRALDAAKEHGKELGIEVVADSCSIRGKKLSGCVMCQRCMQDGTCAIKDDFETLREKWYDADVVLYSIPVYHMGMPAQLKAFIDRLGNSNYGRAKRLYGEHRRGPLKPMQVIGCIAQGIHVFSGQEQTIVQIANHAMLMGALPVSGDGWESYIGAGGWTVNSESRNAFEEQLASGGENARIAVAASESLARRAVEAAYIVQLGALHAPFVAEQPAYLSFRQRVEEHTRET